MTATDTPGVPEAASFADHPVLHISVIAAVLVLAAAALLIRRFRR